ncbi:MAG: Lar family restriction alleviation protein [Defluviitaleaceae bacterium]|nr:Lar family restriction alleviation protein [Defluviitaleaceae bacterium]MCL2275808.1 Lar family restriction alleviation protein [Defluviitaleaceae bacterium]
MEIYNLLPCPFCGGRAEYGKGVGCNYMVDCIDCKAHTGIYRTVKEAEEKWNARIDNVHMSTGDFFIMQMKQKEKSTVHKSKNEQIIKSTVHKSKNEQVISRAGRKPKVTRKIYSDIMRWHEKGFSVRQIIYYLDVFEGVKLSVGLVHKTIHAPAPAELFEDQLTVDDMEATE